MLVTPAKVYTIVGRGSSIHLECTSDPIHPAGVDHPFPQPPTLTNHLTTNLGIIDPYSSLQYSWRILNFELQ